MKVIRIIALNTFHEIIRDRILYGLIIFTLILIGMSLALGQLSFDEQSRISIDFGFTAIHLSAVILAVFLGSSLVAKEIDKKTILTLLVRPISRLEFLLGKCMGLLLVIFVLVCGLAVILGLVSWGLQMPPNMSFVVGLYGIFLEAVLLLGFTLLFSTFARPIMVVVFSIGFFLIGHWIDSLTFFRDRSQSAAFKGFVDSVTSVFPNLERFNWRSLFVYGDTAEVHGVVLSSLYSLCWFVFVIGIAALVIRRKDFG